MSTLERFLADSARLASCSQAAAASPDTPIALVHKALHLAPSAEIAARQVLQLRRQLQLEHGNALKLQAMQQHSRLGRPTLRNREAALAANVQLRTGPADVKVQALQHPRSKCQNSLKASQTAPFGTGDNGTLDSVREALVMKGCVKGRGVQNYQGSGGPM